MVSAYQPTDDVELHQVPKQGLNFPFWDGLLKHVAEDIVKIAKVWAALPTYRLSLTLVNSENVSVFLRMLSRSFEFQFTF